MRMRIGMVYVTGLLSIVLLGFSLWGIFVDPYREYKNQYQLKCASTQYKILDDSFYRNGLSELFLFDLINSSAAMANFDWPEDVNFMPIQENWILYFLRVSDPLVSKFLMHNQNERLFEKIELPNYKKIFSRGFGICSQLSLGVADLLYKRYGIDARVTGLGAHVVVQVLGPSGVNWIIDPSYKTFAAGNVMHPENISISIANYDISLYNEYLTIDNNYISSRSGWGGYSKISENKQVIMFYFIIISYYLKWIIPILILGRSFSFFITLNKKYTVQNSDSINP